jgi:hypothetical protein
MPKIKRAVAGEAVQNHGTGKVKRKCAYLRHQLSAKHGSKTPSPSIGYGGCNERQRDQAPDSILK